MPGPNTADYPDYNRLSSIAGPPLIAGNQNIPAVTTFGPYPVGAYEALRMHLTVVGGAQYVRVKTIFTDLNAAPTLLYQTTYEADQQSFIEDVLPVQGAWVQFQVDVVFGAYPATLDMDITPLVSLPPRSAGAQYGILVSGHTALGGFGTAEVESSIVVPGAAYLTVFSTQKSWWAQVWERSQGADAYLIGTVDATGQRQGATQPFAVGRRPFAVKLADTSGAANTLDWSVTTVL